MLWQVLNDFGVVGRRMKFSSRICVWKPKQRISSKLISGNGGEKRFPAELKQLMPVNAFLVICSRKGWM